MINAADELVTGHQIHDQHSGDAQGSRKDSGAYTMDSELDAALEKEADVSPYPVQETGKFSSLELSRFSITSVDCVPVIGVQNPQVSHVTQHIYICCKLYIDYKEFSYGYMMHAQSMDNDVSTNIYGL